METKKTNYMFIAVVIILLSASGLFLIMIKLINKNSACTSNPLVYGANEIYKRTQTEISCTCTFMNPKYENIIFDRIKMDRESIINMENFNNTLW